MTISCRQCGASLTESDAFCTKCGAARSQPSPVATRPRFCEHCGGALEPNTKFCARCGAAVGDAGVVSPAPPPAPEPVTEPSARPSSPPPPPQAAPVASPRPAPPPPVSPAAPAATLVAPPPKKGSPLFKIVMIVLGIITLIVVAGIGSCFYIGYRIEHKVKQFTGELKGGSDQTVATPKYESRPLGQCEFKNRTGFDEYTSAAASASIPLKAGMTLTDIWPDPKKQQQDVEILHTVQGVHSSAIEISSMRLDGKSVAYTRSLCIADMMNARELETQFGSTTPQEMPGTTMFSLSKAEFEDLKAGRPAALTYYDAYYGKNNDYILWGANKGALSRVEPGDVPYNIIVNGERKDLPTIHAKGTLGKIQSEAWVLDEAANPLILNLVKANSNWHITYLKITFPVEKKIEQELAQTGRAEIYGIYFDFNSATLRPESDPVLKEISDALKHNPGWKIKIDGHTDNVGGDAYNLRLSQRRAESVRQALITKYGITSDRMTPEGFGASRPKATNDTVEGRALNRRVELVRE